MKGIGDVSLEPQNGKVIPYKRHYTNQHNAHPTLRMSGDRDSSNIIVIEKAECLVIV